VRSFFVGVKVYSGTLKCVRDKTSGEVITETLERNDMLKKEQMRLLARAVGVVACAA
jgi:hypothetical protein